MRVTAPYSVDGVFEIGGMYPGEVQDHENGKSRTEVQPREEPHCVVG